MPNDGAHASPKDHDPQAKLTARSPRAHAYPDPVNALLAELTKLPGIGRRGAERIAFSLLKAEASRADALARAITEARRTVRNCDICSNLCREDICAVCANPKRDHSKVLVVEQPRDAASFESAGLYDGLYHVLLGRISPLDGVSPDDLTISALLERVVNPPTPDLAIREVILGLNPTAEGDGTALYIAGKLSNTGVSITKLSRGLPTGAQLDVASKAALSDAIEGRRSMESQ